MDNKFTHKSVEGFVPFVELDGRQIVDSNVIINELTAYFGVRMDEIALKDCIDSNNQLSDKDPDTIGNMSNSGAFFNSRTYSATKLMPESVKKIADFYAYRSLIEDTLRWYYVCFNHTMAI